MLVTFISYAGVLHIYGDKSSNKFVTLYQSYDVVGFYEEEFLM